MIYRMNISGEFETISAIITPMGTGGVGAVRISGAEAFEIAKKMFSKNEFEPGKIAHGWVKDGDEAVDEVILLPFKAPHSFTGEDVVEFQCHGGIKIVKKILDLTLKNGARMAQRGEFTKRAFLNKKMDLSQAEAVLDLIHAKTDDFARKSAGNLSGMLSGEIKEIKSGIITLLSRIVAAIDFPEDVSEPKYSEIEAEIEKAVERIENLLKGAKASNVMRQGIKIAIVGRPNVGKSSLFNRLLSLDRAIVTEIAGTTRDVLQETMDIHGIPATLIDTAGIHAGEGIDKVEAIGIDYTKKCAAEADIVLFLFDTRKGFTREDKEIYDLIKNKPHLKIATKADLSRFPLVLNISTKTGENIEELKTQITDMVLDSNSLESEFTTNQRQEECLKNCLYSLQTAYSAANARQLQDLISIDLKSALMALDELTGEVITDDILDKIFDNFCIGK